MRWLLIVALLLTNLILTRGYTAQSAVYVLSEYWQKGHAVERNTVQTIDQQLLFVGSWNLNSSAKAEQHLYQLSQFDPSTTIPKPVELTLGHNTNWQGQHMQGRQQSTIKPVFGTLLHYYGPGGSRKPARALSSDNALVTAWQTKKNNLLIKWSTVRRSSSENFRFIARQATSGQTKWSWYEFSPPSTFTPLGATGFEVIYDGIAEDAAGEQPQKIHTILALEPAIPPARIGRFVHYSVRYDSDDHAQPVTTPITPAAPEHGIAWDDFGLLPCYTNSDRFAKLIYHHYADTGRTVPVGTGQHVTELGPASAKGYALVRVGAETGAPRRQTNVWLYDAGKRRVAAKGAYDSAVFLTPTVVMLRQRADLQWRLVRADSEDSAQPSVLPVFREVVHTEKVDQARPFFGLDAAGTLHQFDERLNRDETLFTGDAHRRFSALRVVPGSIRLAVRVVDTATTNPGAWIRCTPTEQVKDPFDKTARDIRPLTHDWYLRVITTDTVNCHFRGFYNPPASISTPLPLPIQVFQQGRFSREENLLLLHWRELGTDHVRAYEYSTSSSSTGNLKQFEPWKGNSSKRYFIWKGLLLSLEKGLTRPWHIMRPTEPPSKPLEAAHLVPRPLAALTVSGDDKSVYYFEARDERTSPPTLSNTRLLRYQPGQAPKLIKHP